MGVLGADHSGEAAREFFNEGPFGAGQRASPDGVAQQGDFFIA
jgi:hypothetical protein